MYDVIMTRTCDANIMQCQQSVGRIGKGGEEELKGHGIQH